MLPWVYVVVLSTDNLLRVSESRLRCCILTVKPNFSWYLTIIDIRLKSEEKFQAHAIKVFRFDPTFGVRMSSF